MSSLNSKLAVMIAAGIGAAVLSGSVQAADAPSSEKCYGVAKAGKNDCQTPASSCAGTNKMDGNKQAFLLLPKGTCEKLTNGSVTPGK